MTIGTQSFDQNEHPVHAPTRLFACHWSEDKYVSNSNLGTPTVTTSVRMVRPAVDRWCSRHGVARLAISSTGDGSEVMKSGKAVSQRMQLETILLMVINACSISRDHGLL